MPRSEDAPKFDAALHAVLSHRAAVRGYTVVPAGSGGTPHLPYNAEVEAFFADIGKFLHLWVPMVRDYSEDSRELREGFVMISTAGPEQVKALLTFVWRGERFHGGFWGAQLQSGIVTALLDRLDELHQAGEIRRVEPGGGR